MLKKWGVLLLAALAIATVTIAGANAVTPPITAPSVELSSKAAVMKYLATHGIDTKKIVIQRGSKNYAGPHCPGKGWNCTTSKRVVQISYGPNITSFECTASSGGASAPPNSCLIVQFSSGTVNDARCTEGSLDVTVTQACLIYQSNTTGTNNATIIQQVNTVAGAVQSAGQFASVEQSTTTGSNNATVTQTVVQNAKTTAAGTQTQDDHQVTTVRQQSDTGANNADVSQSLALTAKTSYLPSVTQTQLGDGSLGPNTAASVRQTSTSGTNTGNINQSHDLDANVAHATTASQTQGAPGGGLLGHFEQDSTGVSIANGVQNEIQDMHAAFVNNLSQTQWGPMHMGSPQESNTANRYTIQQTSTQDASDQNAFQDDQQYANCDSSGSCSVRQTINQDGETQTNTCDGPSCHIGQTVSTDDGETSTSTCTGLPSTEITVLATCPFPPTPPPPPPPILD